MNITYLYFPFAQMQMENAKTGLFQKFITIHRTFFATFPHNYGCRQKTLQTGRQVPALTQVQRNQSQSKTKYKLNTYLLSTIYCMIINLTRINIESRQIFTHKTVKTVKFIFLVDLKHFLDHTNHKLKQKNGSCKYIKKCPGLRKLFLQIFPDIGKITYTYFNS